MVAMNTATSTFDVEAMARCFWYCLSSRGQSWNAAISQFGIALSCEHSSFPETRDVGGK